ncbi:GTPase Era [candidate division WOR-3 bacterium]|nr:GTPase Era [candidate division WOR-3 bacterium]
MKEIFKSGYAGIFGLPNAGKSTLLNKILDFELSPVSKKPQMTRNRILGILNGNQYQVVIIDTPGFIDPKYKLQKHMANQIQKTIKDCDVAIYVTEPVEPIDKDVDLSKSLMSPSVLCINKIDKIKDKRKLLPLIDSWRKKRDFEDIILISALQGDNTEKLIQSVVKLLPQGPKYFEEDDITDRNERFYCSEIIRETCFDIYEKEIPYSVSVVIDDFKERDKRKKHYIKASVYVERKSQKGIIIGENGKMIKKLGTVSREKIESFLGKSVFLDLSVKLMKNWKDDSEKISKLGYND